MCENGLLKIKKDGIRPTSQKECFTLWPRWFLKWILESKCVGTQDVEEGEIKEWDWEQNGWEKNKTKDLMTKWIEFKDGRTSFENWNLLEGISERFNTKSLTMRSLFAFEMIFNSITCDCISQL